MDDFAFITARPFGLIIEIIGSEHDFYACQIFGFAAFGNNGVSQLVGAFADALGNFAQVCAAFDRRQPLPCRLRRARRRYGAVNVSFAAFGFAGDGFFGGRVQYIAPFAVEIIFKASVDVHCQLFHFKFSCRCSRV
ncbi:Uncharacterised protein [Mycobacteroides abscessus subsp. massiliense]|nr:Uncharacterised protein [Mycobacteroides abscessus subsp. massiliense]